MKIIITAEDREKYRSYTDDAVIGIKTIKAISDDKLQKMIKSKAQLEKLRLKLGSDTNPNWVKARIAEELYDRELIDEVELDFYTR